MGRIGVCLNHIGMAWTWDVGSKRSKGYLGIRDGSSGKERPMRGGAGPKGGRGGGQPGGAEDGGQEDVCSQRGALKGPANKKYMKRKEVVSP